jgi:DNA-binding transcriptional LysR family regulator
MNIRQAQYLIAVYEEGSISNAAKRLYISQPALSQTIQIVEKEIGARIFNRNTTPISLTYAGEKYLDTARKLIALETNLHREIMEIRQESSGKLRVGISTLRSMALLPRILPRFMQEYPAVELELVETGSTSMDNLVLSGKVDLALLLSRDNVVPDLNYIPLCRERLLLFAGPDTELAKRTPPYTGITIDQAKDERFIAVHPGHGTRTIQDHMFSEYKISPRIIFETHSVEIARRLAIACNAVALFPETLLSNWMHPTGIYYPILGDQFLRELFFCYNKNSYLPRYMADFIKITKTECFSEERKEPSHV